MVGSRRVTTELIEGTWALPDEDLLDPARHPWLNGRLLGLQIIVRGFWHPTGHQDEAARTLGGAIRAHPDLRAHAGRDPELAALRGVYGSGLVEVLRRA